MWDRGYFRISVAGVAASSFLSLKLQPSDVCCLACVLIHNGEEIVDVVGLESSDEGGKTLSDYIKNEQKILEVAEKSTGCRQKNVSQVTYPKLEEALLVWLKSTVASKVPISRGLLKQKAETMALQMNVEGFMKSVRRGGVESTEIYEQHILSTQFQRETEFIEGKRRRLKKDAVPPVFPEYPAYLRPQPLKERSSENIRKRSTEQSTDKENGPP
ncbi:hypothetical protein HPB50_004302 [Hyalomma asiaticum]|uniref:Uncharacterized protein n=1 Tax=Hyalomma asiaticum TaxID=266040 RepID=A0ACB7SMH3_HYAAI|nr:hypothetical protein HPB50_004302 [Hyalomma asiaticum]